MFQNGHYIKRNIIYWIEVLNNMHFVSKITILAQRYSTIQIQYFGRWRYPTLWGKKFIWTHVLFWIVTETELFEYPDLTALDFCLCGCMKSDVYRRKVDTWYELLARILDAAACTKKHADQFRRTTRDLRTRVAQCTEVDGGIFEHLLWTVTNLSFQRNKFFI
jgi:hypothetical protein